MRTSLTSKWIRDIAKSRAARLIIPGGEKLALSKLTLAAFFVFATSLATMLATPARGAGERDFTFFMSSDPHIGTQNKKSDPPITADQWEDRVRGQLKLMVAAVGQPYPAVGPLKDLPPANVARPLGYIIAGDLTDHGDDPTLWSRFESIFPAAGIDNGSIPLYLGAGNHDGGPTSATRLGIIARNRHAQKLGGLDAISENGLHYAWTWQGVHFVCVNLCAADSTDPETPFKYGKPGPGSWNDPLGALTFLTTYLHDKVGNSGEPVIIWSHYGYCEGFNFDWNWWTGKQRRAFYDAMAGYNIVALLHGHTHAPAHYRWPDTITDAREVHRLFGDNPPADMRSYEVFSGGSMSTGTYYVFHVVGNRMIAAHRTSKGWSNEPGMYSVKSISDAPALSSPANPSHATGPPPPAPQGAPVP